MSVRAGLVMRLPVKLDDVIDALEEAAEECAHYLDKRTSEIVMVTNEEMEAAEEDELISEYPEWQREAILKAREILTSDQFVPLPDQFDIHEYKIMEDFCMVFEDRRVGENLRRLIKGSGPLDALRMRSIRWVLTKRGMSFGERRFRRSEFSGWRNNRILIFARIQQAPKRG
jgi:hypothetical protein